jgi:hypothetical protein
MFSLQITAISSVFVGKFIKKIMLKNAAMIFVRILGNIHFELSLGKWFARH